MSFLFYLPKKPSVPAICLALQAVAFVPAIIFGFILHNAAAAIPAFMVALTFAAIFGLPTYLLLQKYNCNFWWAAVIGGALVGFLPTFLIAGQVVLALQAAGYGASGALGGWLVLALTTRKDS